MASILILLFSWLRRLL
ncbi:hypothetical protein [Marinobacter sp. SS8-8]